MSEPVTLAEAKLFLRVTHDAEDGLIGLLIGAARGLLESRLGEAVSDASPAPVRLAALQLVAAAYEKRDGGEADLGLIEPWVAAYRRVRL